VQRVSSRSGTVFRVSILGGAYLLAWITGPVYAQQEDGVFRPFPPPPFGEPQEMLDRIFGADSEAERHELERIEISSEEEEQIGNDAAEAYLDWLRQQRVRLQTKGRDVEYLRALVDVVQPQMVNAERYDDIRIVVARSSVPDARSFPGGTLVVFDGLLEFADSEAALVGVIGHELSHLDRGHQLVRLKGQKLAEKAFAKGGTRNGAALSRMPLLMRVWSRPFRPEDEQDADRVGARWAYQAGYDPREMAKLFLRLHERNERRGANLPLPSFLRSHPYEVERHAAVLKQYEELQAEQPRGDLWIGRENLEQRVPRGAGGNND
jgi:predicted Zn-dependent protease